MKLKNKNIVVIGLGRSGFEVSKFLKKEGAIVTASDASENVEKKKELLELGVNLELGAHSLKTIDKSDLIVLSPGVPLNVPVLEYARKKNIEIISEIELAYRFIMTPIIAITGSNGKTTVTMLIKEMLLKSGFKASVCGNIGLPLVTFAQDEQKNDFLVVEVSSFQLDTIKHFKPKIAVLLNITEDHIDRYNSFEDYSSSKFKIFENQDSDDFAIITRALDKESIKAKKYYFDELDINLKIDSKKFIGKHNKDNIYASAITSIIAGCDTKNIQKAIDDFKVPPHRIEFVKAIDGTLYYNDSKGTNPDATLKALESFEKDIILIMGGLSKGEDYKVLKETIKSKVKKLILLGSSKDMMRKLFEKEVDTELVDSMKEAVKIAKEASSPNDIVLLSPATASFDMYKSYVDRGNDFKKNVG